MKIIYYSFLLLVLLCSCALFDDSPQPAFSSNTPNIKGKEQLSVQIDLPADKYSNSSHWVYCLSVQIDLSKYGEVDSVIFLPNVRSQTEKEKCIAELFDFTNNNYIGNSSVTSKVSYKMHIVRSENIAKSLNPNASRVGIRFRSSKEGHPVALGVGSHVTIYYRN